MLVRLLMAHKQLDLNETLIGVNSVAKLLGVCKTAHVSPNYISHIFPFYWWSPPHTIQAYCFQHCHSLCALRVTLKDFYLYTVSTSGNINQIISLHWAAKWMCNNTLKLSTRKSWEQSFNTISEITDYKCQNPTENRFTHRFIWKETNAKFKRWTEIEMSNDMTSNHRVRLYSSLSCWGIRTIIATKPRSL